MGIRNMAAASLMGFVVLPAHAEWQGKGELGVVLARGNTDTDTASAKFDVANEIDAWKHSVGASALYSTSADVTTGDRYEFHGQSDYKLSERSYALGALRYEHDKFSPYRYQAVGSLGFGYRLLDSEATKLATEVGLGYRRTEDRLTNEVDSDPVVRGGLDYEHKITSNSSVYDKLLVEYGSENTFTQNEAGIKANIMSSLALSVAYQVRHNTTVRAPLKKTDQLMTANLVFSF